MLRRQPEKILVNSLSASSVVAIAGGVTIAGYGDILAADVLDAYCQCAAPCVPQVTTVTVIIPTTCECPYEWPLTIIGLPRTTSYEVQQTFGSTKYYGFSKPDGSAPTAAEAATGIAANINADPFAVVTATVLGAVVTLTEKDCSQTRGFQAFSESGTVVTTTPHTEGILTAIDLKKIFPIQWGHPGSAPTYPSTGTYCLYHITLRKNAAVQDISQANAYNDYEQEVYFYVDSSLAGYVADWETEMQAAFAQFTC